MLICRGGRMPRCGGADGCAYADMHMREEEEIMLSLLSAADGAVWPQWLIFGI